MTTSEQVFLYVAEEMNFTEAARKHYVSQQAVSAHIRKLEEELDTRLFIRSPRLRMTDAGKILYDSLQRIQRIEQHTREAIADGSRSVYGRIRLGVHADRAHVLFPSVFPRFHEMYPNVLVTLVNGHTNDFLEMLQKGQIDFMIGHDTDVMEDLRREEMFRESIYLMTTRKLLTERLPSWNEGRKNIYPQEILQLPMTSTSFGCAMMDHVRSFFKKEELTAQYICETADYLTQLRLCEAGETAFFCPETYLMQRDFQEAMNRQGEERVMAVAVEGMESRIHVELICRKEDFMPRYMREFGKILAEEYRRRSTSIL